MSTLSTKNRARRTTWRRRFLLLALAGCLWLLWTLTVTPHGPYRVPEGAVITRIDELVNEPGRRAQIERHSVESHLGGSGPSPLFTLAFVELDDQGTFWSLRCPAGPVSGTTGQIDLVRSGT